MHSRHSSAEVPVWRCSEPDCQEQWATWTDSSECPFCGDAQGRPTGFTLADLRTAAEKFGFTGVPLPVHIPEPVPDLVQLSTVPKEMWLGLPVFHPLSIRAGEPNWLRYDVGVIIDVYPDPDLPEEYACRFLCSDSATLHYPPWTLWVPAVLADRLAR